MKKNLVLLLAGIVSCTISALSMRPMQDSIRTLPTHEEIDRQLAEEAAQSRKEPKTAQNAFDNVLPKLRNYESKAKPAERENFVKYLNFYKSWYQSTPPAPVEITRQLTNNDREAEHAIRHEAQSFVEEPAQNDNMPRMGASKLSPAGEEYYRMVLNYLQKQSNMQKIPSPFSSKPRQQIKPAKPFINL